MDKAPPPEAVAKVVRWAILIFFAYALLSGSFHILPTKTTPHQPHPKTETAAAPAADKQKDCATETSALQNFSMIASTLIPTMLPSVRVQEITLGTGTAAVCGQQATVRYAYTLDNGTPLFSNLKTGDETQFVIGDDSMLRGFALGLIGMKTGGTRKITFPPALGFDIATNPAAIHDTDKFALPLGNIRRSVIEGTATLTALSPEPPFSSLPPRFIDRRVSTGAHALCGDTVRAEMTIWKMDGTKLFSTTDEDRPLVFKIGASEMPFGIEQAVIGMAEDSQRVVILPAAFARPLIPSDDASHNLLGKTQLPDEAMLADIHLEHIGEEATPIPAAVKPAASRPAVMNKPATGNTSAPQKRTDAKPADDDDDKDDTKN